MEDPIQTTPILLSAALEYANIGWPVFPVHSPINGSCSCGHPDCDVVAKHPRTEHGMLDATTDVDTIREWWTRWPDANIGHRPEPDEMVLDLDGPEGETIEEKNGVPLTPTISTGRGIHALFRIPPDLKVLNRAKYVPGLDIRTHDGYHILPPSLHQNGKRYTWIKGPETPITDCPEWLIKIIHKNQVDVKSYHLENGKVNEGKRNDTLFSLGVRLRYEGIQPDIIPTILQNINDTSCDPPLNDSEVDAIAENAIEHADKKTKEKDDIMAQVNQLPEYPQPQIQTTEEKPESEKSVDEAKLAKRLGDQILSKLHIVTIRDNEEVYIYSGGVYLRYGDTYVKEITQKMLGGIPSTHQVNEVLNYVKRATYHDRDALNPPPNKVCVNNGIIDIDANQLEQFTPDLFFTAKIPVDYNPDAKCPAVEKFLTQVSPGNEKTLTEMLGYCLLREYPLQHYFILEGGGMNGKTTLTLLIDKFLGMDNISTVAMQDLGDRFRKATLYGKLANISDDLSAKALEDSGPIKELTGNGYTTAENKFSAPFNFRNYAKIIFTCNQIPRVYDDSDANYRRIVIISFPNKFSTEVKEDSPATGVYKANPRLIKDLTDAKELSGLLNKALDGLRTIRERYTFTSVETMEKRKLRHIELSDPVQFFALKFIYANPNYAITKRDLYQAYVNYCATIKRVPLADNTFSAQAGRYLPYKADGLIWQPDDPQHLESRVKAWFGIAFCGGEVGKIEYSDPLTPDTIDTVDTVSCQLLYIENLEYGVINIGKQYRMVKKNWGNTVSIVSTVSHTPKLTIFSDQKKETVSRQPDPKTDKEKLLDFITFHSRVNIDSIVGKFYWRTEHAQSILKALEDEKAINQNQPGWWTKT